MFETINLGPAGTLPPPNAYDRGVRLAPEMRSAFTADGAAEYNLGRLLDEPGALCITTGQQPGLFTGPMYTINKALSAVALAHRCEAATGHPVIPVFWVAGDDHDFAESNHCHLASPAGEIDTLRLRERNESGDSTPMYREVLGQDIHAVFARLTELLPESEFRAAYLEWIGRHYRPEATVAGAFAGAMAELLGPYGLVVFSPTADVAKEQMAPFIKAALEGAAGLTDGLGQRVAELESLGRTAPVPVRAGETLVMLEAGRGRDRLLYDGNDFATRRSGETFSASALLKLLEEEPQRFSPNVLLRPAVEAAILPTIAYVAGPGERRYLEQTPPIFEALGIAPQAVVTRWGGRVVEARVQKTLDRYALRPDDLNGPPGQLEGRLAGDDMPADAADSLAALRENLKLEYGRLAEAAVRIDPTMRSPVEAAMHRGEKDLAGIEKRIVGQLKQKNATLVRQIGSARAALFPGGKEQERVLNILQFLTRHGSGALDGAFGVCGEWAASVPSD